MLCLLDFFQHGGERRIGLQQEVMTGLSKGLVRGLLGFLGLCILHSLMRGDKLWVVLDLFHGHLEFGAFLIIQDGSHFLAMTLPVFG